MGEPVHDDRPSLEATYLIRKKFWNARFVFTISILALLALVAGYLQYIYYPLILSDQFAETNVTIHLSFLSFQVSAIRGTEAVPGIPSLDFFQLFLIVIIIVSLSRFFEIRRSPSHDPITSPMETDDTKESKTV